MDPRPMAAGMYSSTDSLRQHLQQQVHMQRSGMGRPDIAAAADARDQQQQDLVGISMDLPITYMPFKFENRRVRIDWRLLHGVDIDKLVRDTDLDTLEQLVTCVTWGDIEAEDTRHLSEGNFVKVFRLAQLLLEYLLYVQENLKYTNGVLDQSRCTAVLHAQGLSTRCSDLYNELKHSKRELKRAHKTVKTFELMAAAVGGAAAAAQAASAAAAATPTKQEAPPPQQQQAQVQQQQGCVMTAGEMLLQSQLAELTERLTLAVCEAERLRTERQELQYQIRHLHDTLAVKLNGNSRNSSGSGASKAARDSSTAATVEAATAAAVAAAQQEQQQLFMAELQCAQAQIDELQAQNKELRSQCKRQSDAATSAAEFSLVALRAELEKKAQEIVRLEGELRERDSSIKVFQTSNTALQQQLDALQRQLTSPEATTPSFVAKQRQQLAAAASAQAGLQAENAQLRQELLELRLALESNRGLGSRGGSKSGAKGSTAAGAADLVVEEAEENALAAAERLLSGDGDEDGAADWKVAEIERLQGENRQLHAKVASLQDALSDLEAENCRLEQRVAAATAAGYASASPAQSPSAAAATAGATAAAESAGLAGGLGAPGWTSVSSSGPAAELTAADLAIEGASVRQAAMMAAAAAADVDTDTAVDSVTLEQSDSSLGTGTTAAEGQAAGAVVKAGAGTEHDAVGDVAAGKVLLNAGSRSTAGGSSEGGRIAAYRPSRDGTTAAPAAAEADAAPSHHQQHSLELGRGPSNADSSSNGGSNISSQGGSSQVGGNHVGSSTVGSNVSSSNGSSAGQPARGAIDQVAAAQLKSLMADMQEKLAPQELVTEYENVCSDWDKPFDLTEAEKEQFRQLLPHEVTGLRDVLCSQQHTAEEVSAAKPGMLSAINRALDTQLASYGIHPGRTGLSNTELLAAMKMLGERREAFEAGLSPAQRDEVEVTRFGLLLHPYHALQSVMATLPDGPDGKKHLPAVAPALASAVRPPASALAQPPAPSQQASHSPVKRQEMYSTVTYHAAPSAGAVAAGAGGAAGGLSGGVRSSGGGVGAGGVYQTRSPSPLGSEAAAEAMAKAAASGSFSPMSAALHAKQALGRGGSPPSSSTGRSVSPLGAAGSPLAYASSAQAAAGWNTVPAGAAVANSSSAGHGRATQQQQQQQQQQQPQQQVMRMSPADSSVQQHQQQVSAAAALATKQYLASSFDSDDF